MLHNGDLYILLACIFGLCMTWGVGANDLANVMSTTMGSKAISVRQAIIIAVIFEFAGAIFCGGGVTETLRNGIINTQALSHDSPDVLIFGMLAVLLSGTAWMTFASICGLPVSITNTIVGSIVGFGVMVLGVHAVHWHIVSIIAISWITSPLLAGIVSYALFASVQGLVLTKPDPVLAAKKTAPYYLFLIGAVISTSTVLRGIKHAGIDLSTPVDIACILGTGIIITVIGMVSINRIEMKSQLERRDKFELVEKIFGVLMFFTACAMIFGHGSNDVANAVGPMAVIISIVRHGDVTQSSALPIWTILLGCTGVIIGLLMYGRKVIATVGSGITALTPSRAFAATFAAASTVVLATSTGIPVSTTQILVGGVFGVGLARGIGALNLRVMRNIFMSWIITLPAGAILTIGFYYLLKWVL